MAAATAATAAIRLTGAPGDDASGGAIFLRPKSGRSGGVDPARSRVTPTVPLHELPPHADKALCVTWDGAERLLSGGADGELRALQLRLPAL